MWFFDTAVGTTLLGDYQTVWVVLAFAGVPAVASALTIELAQTLKYDIVPAAHALIDDPESAFSTHYHRIITHPSQMVRRSWDDL